MKAILLFFIFMSLNFHLWAQDVDSIKSPIVTEGKKMYRSEMASWYGTDIFLEKYPGQRANIGGYFSYTNDDITKCLFFSKSETPKVLATISFDSSYNTSTAIIDDEQRAFTSYENDIYLIRKKALAIINSGTLFKTYQNTNLNLIPIINETEKKVYVLTGPESNGVVIFGNDYLLTFDNDNNLIEKKQLHKNIITINYGQADANVVGTMHTHLPETGDFITSTDICTLMLYEKFAKWNQHYVISENYVSIWDCEKNMLETLTREAWDKMYANDKKKRRKD